MGSFQLGRGEQLQCWRNVALLRDLAIQGDFTYRLNVAAADYAGSRQLRSRTACCCFQRSSGFRTMPSGVLWSLSVSSLLLLSGQGSALKTENQTKLEQQSNRLA
jgi:hypothetical protein